MNKEHLLKTFDSQITKLFDFNEASIERKFHHSKRVGEKAEQIALSEGQDEETVMLSFIVGLLHDYGRFFQWTKYKTFFDHKSDCHSKIGIEELFENGGIDGFEIPKIYYPEIKKAIFHHNKVNISEQKEMSERENFLCKVVRDADKWDLFYLMLTFNFPMVSERDGLSPLVWKNFENQQAIRVESLETKLDSKIYNLSHIYNLNFNEPRKWISNNDFLKKYYKIKEKLLNDEDKQKLFLSVEMVRKYLICYKKKT